MARRGRPRTSLSSPKAYPTRTREHVIAHQSVRYVQWLAAKCGYIAEVPEYDYGYDLHLYTFDDEGYPEPGTVAIQLKATTSLTSYMRSEGAAIGFPIDQRHLRLWRRSPFPVIFIVFDAATETGYWLSVQQYRTSSVELEQESLTVRIPINSILNEAAIHEFRRYKIEVNEQMERLLRDANE